RTPLYDPISVKRLIFRDVSRRRSPSIVKSSIALRIFPSSSSVRSRTRVSSETPASLRTFCAVVFPTPKIYVREITTRLSRGISIPAIRAIMLAPPWLLTLFLLVSWIFANHHYFAFAFDNLAFFTNWFYRCSYFHHLYLLLYRSSRLFITVRNSSSCSIIRRKFNRYFITW